MSTDLDILVLAPRGKPPKQRVEGAKLGVFERKISLPHSLSNAWQKAGYVGNL